MPYDKLRIIDTSSGNNAFAWQERQEKCGKSPTLFTPSLIEGNIEDVQIGEEIVFEEVENGKLKSCVGLKNFVHIPKDPLSFRRQVKKGVLARLFGSWGEAGLGGGVTIFDNHNHALYFWIDAVKKGVLKPGFTLIHIDEHSDLWENTNELNLEKALEDERYTWDFTNLSCNVGNYIYPAIRSGLVGKMIRIENESQMDEFMNFDVPENTVLNLDLDIFAPELDFIPEEKKLQIIRNLLQKSDYATIATSPYFIDQGTAIAKLQKILA